MIETIKMVIQNYKQNDANIEVLCMSNTESDCLEEVDKKIVRDCQDC